MSPSRVRNTRSKTKGKRLSELNENGQRQSSTNRGDSGTVIVQLAIPIIKQAHKTSLLKNNKLNNSRFRSILVQTVYGNITSFRSMVSIVSSFLLNGCKLSSHPNELPMLRNESKTTGSFYFGSLSCFFSRFLVIFSLSFPFPWVLFWYTGHIIQNCIYISFDRKVYLTLIGGYVAANNSVACCYTV
ncbi:uncharacterized protein EV154DRAFT_486126 [Mucor mucedo]|uniref:uncharacterized protein n=1 Tax=Mucor mucedo TaxID=29922 RepID=UPI00221FEBA3|nr:uncharacterized protein EV154DRAFT_486126 [Mucor mucedo]KAI7878987.1 hypothetical protein EV154DRAFT_486126 [Mucor mucedo]